MKHIFLSIMLTLAFFLPKEYIHADDSVADSGAQLISITSQDPKDLRYSALKNFLHNVDSPMLEASDHAIREADRLEIDWRLVIAIAGLESTYGKHIPVNSYNAYGWGIPSGATSGVVFQNWEDSITKISEGLRYKYIDKGAVTIEQIGAIYASSPTWAERVRKLMSEIDKNLHTPENLSLTL